MNYMPTNVISPKSARAGRLSAGGRGGAASPWAGRSSQEPSIEHIAELCRVVGSRAQAAADSAKDEAERLVSGPRNRGPHPSSAAPSPYRAVEGKSPRGQRPSFPLTHVPRRDASPSAAVASYAASKQLHDVCAEVERLARHVESAHGAQVAVLRHDVATLRKLVSQWRWIALRHDPYAGLDGVGAVKSVVGPSPPLLSRRHYSGGSPSSYVYGDDDADVEDPTTLKQVVARLRDELRDKDALLAAKQVQIDHLTGEVRRLRHGEAMSTTRGSPFRSAPRSMSPRGASSPPHHR